MQEVPQLDSMRKHKPTIKKNVHVTEKSHKKEAKNTRRITA